MPVDHHALDNVAHNPLGLVLILSREELNARPGRTRAAHELLRNALTHAFPAGTGGHVGVHLWHTQQAKPRAYLLIADDGCGFGDEPITTADCGLTLARNFLDAVGAQLEREPGRGTVWRIGLP